MHALTTFHPGSSFLRFGAWSVLLHISAVAMVGVLHVTRPADSALSRVTVTLLESPTPVSNNAPPVAPQQVPPSPRLLRLPPQHPTTAPDIPQPPTRHAVPQEQQTAGIGKPNATTVWTSHEVSTPAFSTTHPYAPDAPKTFRDATADRKGLRTPARPIKSDHPPYPYTASKQGWEGTVVLRLTVSREGIVEQAAIHTSSGFPILDESALQAVQAWRFEPAKDGEFPISATVEQPIRFALNDP